MFSYSWASYAGISWMLKNQNIQNIVNSFQPITPQGPSQSLPPDLQSQINLFEWQQAFQNQRDSFVVMSNILRLV
jgi:hypothetical protein